jgi:hypothetical protein
MAYGTTDENTLYVVGGAHYTGVSKGNFTTQFYALNLTQTGWNTSNPPWTMMSYPTSLLPRAISRFQYSMALSPDNSTLGVWDVTDADRLVEYSVGNASWTSATITDSLSGNGVQAVTDPTTGLVYFPGGGPANYSAMMVYNPTTGMITDAPSSYPIVNGTPYYSFTWNSQRNKFIYFTGKADAINPFYEFTPSTGQWSQMVTNGTTPLPQFRSCLVSAKNGSKMILFGGDNGFLSSSSLYILDVPTMTWSMATNASEERSGMACSVSGDRFVVWGGFKALNLTSRIGVSAVPLVYNLANQTWTTTY